MQKKYCKKSSIYDGAQLRHLFGYLEHQLLGDSIISWRGACNIPQENIIDGEDLQNNSIIASKEMLHFIVEKFNSTIFSAVALQRLFVTLIKEDMQDRGIFLKRKGDDLYFITKDNLEKKFNISIATQSTTSSMIHLAVNITQEGTPVPTISLKDFNICSDQDIKALSEKWMDLFTQEVISITKATEKVFTV
ncbi:MAG: DUF366 family protein [Bdellovibrionaceae bacterium]|nr:DUF366 family protein [Pseudobdellovibrionaceae bacterium]